MLHLHFDFLERTHEGYLLTDEHHEMLAAIQARDLERADKLAHDHTRQFRDSFIAFMKENYATDMHWGRRGGVALKFCLPKSHLTARWLAASPPSKDQH